MDLRDLTAENTQPLVGTKFRLELADGNSVDLTLDRVEVLLEKHMSKRMKRDSFGMYFSGPPNLYLPQGLYTTYHETIDGPIGIFYVPISRREHGGYEFEAIFAS